MKQAFYTAREIGAALQVDEGTVKRWIREGRLEAVKIGAKVLRISGDSFERFLTSVATPSGHHEGGEK